MNLDLNFYFTNVKGNKQNQQYPDGHVEEMAIASKYMGNELCKGNNPEHSRKLADIGETLYKEGKIEIDGTDLKLFEEEIKKYNISNQMRKQVLEAIEKARLTKTEKKA